MRRVDFDIVEESQESQERARRLSPAAMLRVSRNPRIVLGPHGFGDPDDVAVFSEANKTRRSYFVLSYNSRLGYAGIEHWLWQITTYGVELGLVGEVFVDGDSLDELGGGENFFELSERQMAELLLDFVR
jgi:hypothetical protein